MVPQSAVSRIRDFQGLPAACVDDGYERRTIRGRGLRARFAATCLRLGGWTVGGAPPTINKYVIVAAPHTTWWDGFWMLAFAWVWGVDLAWMGKASLTRGPLGWIPRACGVIPVERSAPQGLVAQIVEQFESRESLLLAIPPEGTRGKRDYWKSGFYQIAVGAELPICLSYLDYKTREAGFGPMIEPDDDVCATMDRVRAFYKTEWAKHPQLFTPPLLREEQMSPVVPLKPRVEPATEPEVREVAQA
ncbi:Acyltransferase [Enhygromyxa salina]|uniref:Acyltransferase n=1 Tax=Enhygromyxa salina TaxID=215803 RepID=A0A2S9Y4A7_9BACT|nr:Acyltransferase [Enhygromyxa salina]